MRRTIWLGLGLAALWLPLGACTTTYTEADLAQEEIRQDKEDRREERTDAKIDDESGGANAEEIEHTDEEVDQESDL